MGTHCQKPSDFWKCASWGNAPLPPPSILPPGKACRPPYACRLPTQGVALPPLRGSPNQRGLRAPDTHARASPCTHAGRGPCSSLRTLPRQGLAPTPASSSARGRRATCKDCLQVGLHGCPREAAKTAVGASKRSASGRPEFSRTSPCALHTIAVAKRKAPGLWPGIPNFAGSAGLRLDFRDAQDEGSPSVRQVQSIGQVHRALAISPPTSLRKGGSSVWYRRRAVAVRFCGERPYSYYKSTVYALSPPAGREPARGGGGGLFFYRAQKRTECRGSGVRNSRPQDFMGLRAGPGLSSDKSCAFGQICRRVRLLGDSRAFRQGGSGPTGQQPASTPVSTRPEPSLQASGGGRVVLLPYPRGADSGCSLFISLLRSGWLPADRATRPARRRANTLTPPLWGFVFRERAD